MKNILLILIVIINLSLFACSPKGWTPENTQMTLDKCKVRAEKFLGESETEPYCNCVTNKLQKAYPDYATLNSFSEENLARYWEIIDLQIAQCSQEQFFSGVNKLDSTKKVRLRTDLSQWNPINEKKLIKAAKGILPPKIVSKIIINDYCSCILQRSQFRYPNFDSIVPLLKNKAKFEAAFKDDYQACVVASLKDKK